MAVKDLSDGQLDYLKETIQQNQVDEVSKFRSIAGAFPKGVSKFLVEQGESTLDMLQSLRPGFLQPTQEQEASILQYQPSKEEKLASIERVLPTRQDFPENVLERGGKIAPLALTGAGTLPEVGSVLLRSLLAGGSGEIAKQLGFGEIGQSVAESLPFLAPSFAERIPIAKREKDLAEFARSQGMTEKELALALEKGGLKDEAAAFFSSRGKSLQRSTDATYNRLSNIYDNMYGSEYAKSVLTGQQEGNLINSLSKKLSKMPNPVREKIEKDFNEFIGKEISGDNLMDFTKKLNYYIEKGDGVLGLLKKDLDQAANNISPEFAKDFKLLRKLYQNFKTTVSDLRPDIADKLIGFGEGAQLVKAVATRDLGLLKSVLGFGLGRKIAEQLIKNPRLQNLTLRLTQSLNQNKKVLASRIVNMIQDELGKENAEAAKILSQFDVDELFERLQEEGENT